MTVPAVELKDLSLHYMLQGAPQQSQRVDVLHNVNLRIEAGQSLAVVGPSGSGKTSLLLLLSGLERPASGDVLLSGTSLAALDADGLADMRRERVGIIFQSFHLLPSLTALDNVALPLQMAGQRDAHQRATALLRRVGLGARLHQWPATLSGGEQQRVAIARALVHRPQLLLADEPTGNLDDATGATVRELLFDLNREAGTTLVLVTHDQNFARRCQRVLRLQDGQLREQTLQQVHEHTHEHKHEQRLEQTHEPGTAPVAAPNAALPV